MFICKTRSLHGAGFLRGQCLREAAGTAFIENYISEQLFAAPYVFNNENSAAGMAAAALRSRRIEAAAGGGCAPRVQTPQRSAACCVGKQAKADSPTSRPTFRINSRVKTNVKPLDSFYTFELK